MCLCFFPATGCEFHCNDKCFTTWQEFCTSECAPGNCGKLGLLILLLSIGCPLIHEYNANSLLCTTTASLFSRYFNFLSSLRAHTLAWSEIFSLCCTVCLVHPGHTHTHTHSTLAFWAIQAGLLTPLTFVRHRLSPLAAFTSGAYFLQKRKEKKKRKKEEGGNSELANFTQPTLKAFLEARSQNVSGSKQ